MEEKPSKIMVASIKFEPIKYRSNLSCRHVTNFIYLCLHSDSNFIRYVVLHGIQVSRTNSPIGLNAAFCSLHYNTRIDNLFDTKFSSHYCFARFKFELSTDLLARANAVREAILI